MVSLVLVPMLVSSGRHVSARLSYIHSSVLLSVCPYCFSATLLAIHLIANIALPAPCLPVYLAANTGQVCASWGGCWVRFLGNVLDLSSPLFYYLELY